jgi:hypothetical protein
VIVQYQKLHILYDTNAIRNQARTAIGDAGGDPDHPNITWHSIPNENAWMRDNGSTVPEPAALLQLASGCLALSVLNARRRRRH